MKLKILSPLPPAYQSRYVVEVEFMYGDGDHYKTIEFDFHSDAGAIEFLYMLNQLKKGYIPNLHKLSDPIDGPYLFENWPYDVDADRPTYYQGYEVYFYDVNGNKCPVKVTKGK